MFSTDDTIVAIATPPGRGGIGVVRLSGPDAHARRAAPDRARRAARRRVTRRSRDRRVASTVRPIRSSSRTFPRRTPTPAKTSSRSARTAARWCCARSSRAAMAAGARLAEPGEFTLRAFLNGRIDLVQAEAVARSDRRGDAAAGARGVRSARRHADRRASARSTRALFDLIARLEASLDFPDEGYHFVDAGRGRARARCDRRVDLDALLATAARGRLIREGLHGRDRRPAERRQVEPVQPARRRGPRDRRPTCPGRRAIC